MHLCWEEPARNSTVALLLNLLAPELHLSSSDSTCNKSIPNNKTSKKTKPYRSEHSSAKLLLGGLINDNDTLVGHCNRIHTILSFNRWGDGCTSKGGWPGLFHHHHLFNFGEWADGNCYSIPSLWTLVLNSLACTPTAPKQRNKSPLRPITTSRAHYANLDPLARIQWHSE